MEGGRDTREHPCREVCYDISLPLPLSFASDPAASIGMA